MLDVKNPLTLGSRELIMNELDRRKILPYIRYKRSSYFENRVYPKVQYLDDFCGFTL